MSEGNSTAPQIPVSGTADKMASVNHTGKAHKVDMKSVTGTVNDTALKQGSDKGSSLNIVPETTGTTDKITQLVVKNSTMGQLTREDSSSVNDSANDNIACTTGDDTLILTSQAPPTSEAGAENYFTSSASSTISTTMGDNSKEAVGLSASNSFHSILEHSMNFDFDLPALPRMSTFFSTTSRVQQDDQKSDGDEYMSAEEESFVEERGGDSEERISAEEGEGNAEDEEHSIEVGDVNFYEDQEGTKEDPVAVDEEDDHLSSPLTTRVSQRSLSSYEGLEGPFTLPRPRVPHLDMNRSSDYVDFPGASALGPEEQSEDDSLNKEQIVLDEDDQKIGSSAPRQRQSLQNYDDLSPCPSPAPFRSEKEKDNLSNSVDRQIISPNVTLRKKKACVFTLGADSVDNDATSRSVSGGPYEEFSDTFVEEPVGGDTTHDSDDTLRGRSISREEFDGSSEDRFLETPVESRSSFHANAVTPRQFLLITSQPRVRSTLNDYGEDFENKELDMSVTPTKPLAIRKESHRAKVIARKYSIESIVPRPLSIHKENHNVARLVDSQEASKHEPSAAATNDTSKESSSAVQKQVLKQDRSDAGAENVRLVNPYQGASTVNKANVSKPLPAAPESDSPVQPIIRGPKRTKAPVPYQGENNFKFPAHPNVVQPPEHSRTHSLREQLGEDVRILVRNSCQLGQPELERQIERLINDLPEEELAGAKQEIEFASRAGTIKSKGFWKKLASKLKLRIPKKNGGSSTDHVHDAPMSSMSRRITVVLDSEADPAVVIPDFHSPSYKAGLIVGMKQSGLANSQSRASFMPPARGTPARPAAEGTYLGATFSPNNRPMGANDVRQRQQTRVEEPRGLSQAQEAIEELDQFEFYDWQDEQPEPPNLGLPHPPRGSSLRH